jgi:hypothetical protein
LVQVRFLAFGLDLGCSHRCCCVVLRSADCGVDSELARSAPTQAAQAGSVLSRTPEFAWHLISESLRSSQLQAPATAESALPSAVLAGTTLSLAPAPAASPVAGPSVRRRFSSRTQPSSLPTTRIARCCRFRPLPDQRWRWRLRLKGPLLQAALQATPAPLLVSSQHCLAPAWSCAVLTRAPVAAVVAVASDAQPGSETKTLRRVRTVLIVLEFS